MRRILFFMSFLCSVLLSWAVPAQETQFKHRQKDGTELTLRLTGDEFMHYFVNVATGERMEQGADGDYVAIPSALFDQRRRLADSRRAEINAERCQRLPLVRAQAQSPNGKRNVLGTVNHLTGTKKAMVLLVEFADTKFTYSRVEFQNMFNQKGYNRYGHVGSLKDYFEDQSYGQVSIDFDIYGPVTLSNTTAYYGANDMDGEDVRSHYVIYDALSILKNQGALKDLSPYDWDGDRQVDEVIMIFAGLSEASGAPADNIWPHAAGMPITLSVGGYTIYPYCCASELAGASGTNLNGIGTICHEFSHCLGFPDFYDADYEENGRGWGMSSLDLMGQGNYNGPNFRGEVPCGYSAWERWQAGWLTPIELNAPNTVRALPSIDLTGRAYIMRNSSNSNEYLILENRQCRKWFTYSYRNFTNAHGMLITHVDYNYDDWNGNSVNTDGSNQRYTYVCADGWYNEATPEQMAGDFFPGYYGYNTFSDTSHAGYYGKFKNPYTPHKTLTNIVETNGYISFDYDGGGVVDDGYRYKLTLSDYHILSTWTQSSYQQAYTLPEPTGTFTDWTPAGWSTRELTTRTSPDDFTLLAPGTAYEPLYDVTLYSVYRNAANQYMSYPDVANYSISLDVNEDITVWTQGAARSLTLPAVQSPEAGWTFAGWSSSPVVSQTTSAPSLLQAGTTITPTADLYYYAVFSRVESGEANTYRLVDHLTPGCKYVIALSNSPGSTKAMDGETLATNNSGSHDGTAVTVTADLTIIPNSRYPELTWNCTKVGSAFYLQTNHSGTYKNYYLTIDASGKMKTQSSNTYGALYWMEEYGLLYSTSSSTCTRFLVGGSSFTASNQVSSSPVYFYEYAESTTYYSSDLPKPNYTVAFEAYSGTSVESLTQTAEQRDITLPSASSGNAKWPFFGWAVAPLTSQTETIPEVMLAGDSYRPKADVTFHAVYFNGKAYISNTADYVPYGGTLDPGLMFPHVAKVGQSFKAPKVATKSEGAISYSSSNPEVATVDAETGKITAVAPGIVVITVCQAADGQYKAAYATYTLKVEE